MTPPREGRGGGTAFARRAEVLAADDGGRRTLDDKDVSSLVIQLLEREFLLAELGRLLDRASDGDGSLAFAAGEAGVGKTSLARACTEGLQQRATVLWGGCDALSTPRPLGPLIDMAATPGSGIADLVARLGSSSRR